MLEQPMLSGKMLRLSWRGNHGWYAELNGVSRRFDTLRDLDCWLCRVIEFAEDREKAKLLIEDRKLLTIPEMLCHE
jgi:hypothetical protein